MSQHYQDPNDVIETEAANWVARLASKESTSEDKRQALEWRRRSPEHEQVFQEVRRLWLGLESLSDARPASDPVEQRSQVTLGNRAWKNWAVAAMLTLVALGALFEGDRVAIWLADYRTGIGERQSLTLDDGSTIHLNTDTALSVEYTSTHRRVELLSGEATFLVAKDETRPFIVQADEGQIQALGTAFAVRNHDTQTLVTLLEGLVDVKVETSRTDLSPQVQLHPGQQVAYSTAAGIQQVQTADLRLATAWQRGLLIFEETPLRKVLGEINRYRSGYVVLTNDDVALDRVSGVFHLDNLDRALETIQSQLHLSTLRITDYVVFLR
ncbi:FecR family protein [Nitrospira sp. M1]